MRAFVAIEISEAIRNALGDLLAELRTHGAPVKWVRPENLHLTLKFLGDVPEESAPKAVEILRKCAEDVAPFEMDVKGAGGFPNLKRPRVLFVEAHDSPPRARELARRLNREMTRAGVPREDRPFRSHVTLGRMRRPRPLGAAAHTLAAAAERSFGAMTVERITLMQSDLTPKGPIYTPVQRVALAPRNGNEPQDSPH